MPARRAKGDLGRAGPLAHVWVRLGLDLKAEAMIDGLRGRNGHLPCTGLGVSGVGSAESTSLPASWCLAKLILLLISLHLIEDSKASHWLAHI